MSLLKTDKNLQMKAIFLVSIFLAIIHPTFAQQKLENLNARLVMIQKDKKLPALGAVAIVDGELRAIGAVGMRKFDGKEKVTVDDKWHIGSCTKSMTATLAGTFVEEGKLKWDSTIGEILGRKIRVGKEYEGVTLEMLVSNRSGIPSQPPSKTWSKAWDDTGKRDIAKRRMRYAEEILNEKPEFDPGTDYAYSNSGFVVAGVMMEAIANKPWETLMEERIFKPLKMESAGFGVAAGRDKEDQPWGHHSLQKPQEPGVHADNPDVMGPAGTVHASLRDLARYAQMHAMRTRGPVLKKAETFQFLQSIAEGNNNYAHGWMRVKRGWANGDALTHAGSNTMNYCVIWLAPERGFAGIAVSNIGADEAGGACDAVVSEMIGMFLK